MSALALLATNLAVRHCSCRAGAIFAFAVAWTVAEWVRGHAFTGLPWNLIGYAWSGGFPGAILMLQSVAWLGIYGLSFLTVLAASLPALLGITSLDPLSPARRFAPAIAAGLLDRCAGLGGALRLTATPTVERPDIWLRIVQPSIPQNDEVGPGRRATEFSPPPRSQQRPGRAQIAAVLWPEAATPFCSGAMRSTAREIAAVASGGGYVITGALRANPPPGPVAQVWNSIEAVDGNGDDRRPLRQSASGSVRRIHAAPRDLAAARRSRPAASTITAGAGPQND